MKDFSTPLNSSWKDGVGNQGAVALLENNSYSTGSIREPLGNFLNRWTTHSHLADSTNALSSQSTLSQQIADLTHRISQSPTVSAPGDKVWRQPLGGLLYDGANGVAVDPTGKIVIAGYTEDDGQNPNSPVPGARPPGIPLNKDILLAKYSPKGQLRWVKQWGSLRMNDVANAIATDSAGNIYIVGKTDGKLPSGSLPPNKKLGSSDAFVAKFNKSGTFLWSRQFGSARYDQANGVAVDSAGNIYVTGEIEGTPFGINDPTSDAFVAKFSQDGKKLWKTSLGIASSLGYGVAVSPQGNVYIAGDITNADPAEAGSYFADGFAASYDSNGNFLWGQAIGSDFDDHARGIASDRFGNVYVTGSFEEALRSGSAYIAQLNGNSGEGNWFNLLAGADSIGRGVAVDQFDQVYVTGLKHAGYQGFDGFLSVYDKDGGSLWDMETKKASLGLQVNGVAVDRNAGVYLTGVSKDKNAFLWKYEA